MGLILSGGGAPGIAHIGVIKALEENNIPIDCISGTSIGAIVGSMYAMGYTAIEMQQLLKSSEFKYWMRGEIESQNRYDYRTLQATPTLLNFGLSNSKALLPTSFVPSAAMNYAFIPLFAQANAVSGCNFDSLMVPFRCVASDVYHKRAVVFSRANLGNAVRASMTFPFMFKPIRIDDNLLFDGGIYNNFPSDVMQNEFHPNFSIGSVVAYNTPKATDEDVLTQLQNMIIHHSNYGLADSAGMVLKFNLASVDVFNFSNVDSLVKIGYDSTVKHINEIKAQVNRRVTCAEITARRQKFKSRFSELKFQQVSLEGIDSLQKCYLLRYFPTPNRIFTIDEFRKAYFQIIADEAIQEVIPEAIFDSTSGLFDLSLKLKLKPALQLSLGGNISSSGFNQAYVGLKFQKLADYAFVGNIEGQLGQVYTGLAADLRFDFPSQFKCYLKADAVMQQFNYTKTEVAPQITQQEYYANLRFGVPLGMKTRLELGLGAASQSDLYGERSQFATQSAFLRIESNTLNERIYPYEGQLFNASIRTFNGNEVYSSMTVPASIFVDKYKFWTQFSAKMDSYLKLTSAFKVGVFAQASYSDRALLSNQFATSIHTPAFQPTAFSQTVFNPAFHANQFAAVGLKPIFCINNQLQLRQEAYWFVPVQIISQSTHNISLFSQPIAGSQFMSETSLVYNFKLASAALFAHYATGRWNVGLHIGVLLFKPKFEE